MSRVRPLPDGVIAAAVLVVLIVATFARQPGADDRPLDVVGYLFLVAFAAATYFRRAWPVPVLAVCTLGIFGYYAQGFPPVGLELPLAVPIYTVAAAGRWKLAALWAAAVTIFAFASRVLVGQDPLLILGLQLPTTVAVLGGAIALGDAVRSRHELRLEQDRALAAVRSEAEQRTSERLALERVQLARDLHDVLGHTVSVVSLHAAVAEEALLAGDRDDALQATRAIQQASSTAMRDLRGTVQVLRGDTPSSRDPVGGLAAVEDLVASARAAGLEVSSRIEVDPATVPATAGMTAYRVIQEGLTNVLRHAAAEHAWVQVGSEPGALLVQVEDDGRGATGTGIAGSGLRGMAERVQLVGGSVRTGSRDGGGFSVWARIPT